MLLACAVPAQAEWHVKPFFGITFAGQTTFVDIEDAAGKTTRASKTAFHSAAVVKT